MAQYQLDKMHSEVNFKVKHLMISTVSGLFSEFDSSVETEGEDFTNAKINFTVNTNSISTNNGQRDEHLKSADFFDSANHPEMTFTSTELKKIDNSQYELVGDLSIRGHVKSVSLKVNYEGKMVDFYGNEKHGFEVSGVINRKEFGLAWSAVTEAGGIVVSDEVKILANIQYQKI
jgi:polyisoprenoid-binding protein YceI